MLNRGDQPEQAIHLLRLYLQQRPDHVHGHRLLVGALVASDAPASELAGALEDLAPVEAPSARCTVLLHLAETRVSASTPNSRSSWSTRSAASATRRAG